MGKKYLNTKEGSIEQSVLDVWQEAAEMHDEGMDGRTKEYRSHRGKLESNRVKRENKKSSVKTEQPETLDGSGEHAYELGTDRYAEYTQKLTPGQIEEEVELNEDIITKAVKGIATVAKRYGTVAGRAGGAEKKLAKIQKKKKDIERLATARANITKEREKIDKEEGELDGDDAGKEVNWIKEGVTMENRNLVNTIKNLWIEAAAAAVDPKEREELDKEPDGRGGVESAKKMKRAKEPAPNVSESLYEGTKEEYEKFFNAAMKKFKINSPADLKSDEEKKKFFDYVDKNYKGEKSEDLLKTVEDHESWLENKKIVLAKEFKVSSMRQALEKVWSVAEGELPPALKKAIDAKKDKEKKEDNDEKDDDDEKKGNTMTGKKKAAVDVSPHQSYH